MCGRYVRKSDKQRIAEEFHLRNLQESNLEFLPNFNVAPRLSNPLFAKTTIPENAS